MKLGFVSAILDGWSFEEMIDTAHDLGFSCVEAACWPSGKAERRYAGVSHIDVDGLTDEKAAYILGYCKERGVELSSLAFYPNTMDEDLEKRAANIAHLKKVILASEKLGVGMVTTFVGRATHKTVEENLEMGAYSVKMSKADMDRHLEEQYEIFPRLKERAKQKAGSMSGGEQQMLAIARGLMSDPELLMLDEPSLGLAPVIVDDMFDVIVRVNKVRNIPIAIVEQNAFMAMSISNRTYVLEVGNLVASGDSKVLMDSDDIKKAYLGG